MKKNTTSKKTNSFKTKRLTIRSWKPEIKEKSKNNNFAKKIIKILTPAVTKSLPGNWQKIDNIERSINWINDRDNDSNAFLLELKEEKKT